MFLSVKKTSKGYKLWDTNDKMFVLSRFVTFDEPSMLRPNSQQVEGMKTKEVSQQVEDDATPRSLVDSISVEIVLDVTLGGDHVAILDAKHVEEKVDLIAVRRTKKNQQKWVVKKHGSQFSKLNQLKLKTVVLHDSIGKEIHITQSIGSVAANLVSVDS